MPPTKHLLRIEGVNVLSLLFDTADQSTSRGGGLLLLEGVDSIRRSTDFNLDPVHVGASIGLFSVECEADQADVLRSSVEKVLRDHPDYRYCTFVVDIVAAPNPASFTRDEEALKAMNRWRQMQSPSLVFPDPIENAVVCEKTRLRPAPAPKGSVSPSVAARRDVGRDRRETFIYAKLGENGRSTGAPNPAAGASFVRDFEQLATVAGSDRERFSMVDRKMAVITCDGNGFSPIRDRHCKDPVTRSEWSRKLEDDAVALVWDLVTWQRKDPAWFASDGRIRFESLMWGGDEFTWVVPAWLGWKTVAFLRAHFNSRFPVNDPAGDPLRYATGVVFCHHKAPIHRVRKLAYSLCELAKSESRTTNLVAYQTLESFDHYGMDVERARNKRLPDGIEPRQMLLKLDDVPDLLDEIAVLKDRLARRRISRLLAVLHETADTKVRDSAWRDAVLDLDDETFEALRSAADRCGKDFAVWIHLAEMWDYVIA